MAWPAHSLFSIRWRGIENFMTRDWEVFSWTDLKLYEGLTYALRRKRFDWRMTLHANE